MSMMKGGGGRRRQTDWSARRFIAPDRFRPSPRMAAPRSPAPGSRQLPRSHLSQTPAEISIIIYGGRNIWKKNEQRRPLYVVFGVGSQYYRTSSSKDLEPKWNETQSIPVVSDLLSLRITLREERNGNDDDPVIGRVRIPILGLPDASKSKELLVKFSSDNPKFNGYLVYKCHITKYRPTAPFTPIEWTKRHAPLLMDYLRNFEMPEISAECVVDPFLKLLPKRNSERETPQVSPVVLRKLMQASMRTQLTFGADVNEIFPQIGRMGVEKRKKTLSALVESPPMPRADISRKKSVKIMQNAIVIPQSTAKDPIHFLSLFTGELTERSAKKSFFKKRNLSDPDLEQMGQEKANLNCNHAPKLISIEPKSGPVWGCTKITITGENLGEDASDINGLYVCGSNCLSTLQYESPQRITCVTKAWRACIGSIVLVTNSGGRGVSLDKFTFVPDEPDHNLLSVSVSFDTISLSDEPDLSRKVTFADINSRVSWSSMLRQVDEATQTNLDSGSSSSRMSPDQQVEVDDLRELVDSLQQQVQDLKETNQQQQKYVEALVARVMEECPTALCRSQRR